MEKEINKIRNRRKSIPKMIKKLMILTINAKPILKKKAMKKYPEKTSSYLPGYM
jgi:hypothetical protein